jgi:hypothetical protein
LTEFAFKSPGPVASGFMKSDAFVRGLRGPVGSGKSVTCAVELFRRALEQKPNKNGVRKTRYAVVRNTNPELRTTTIKTWLDWFPEETYGRFNWTPPYTHNIAVGPVEMEVIFLALDKPEDVKKLLSLELSGAWINEAREIPKSIVDAVTMRVDRYPSLREGGCTHPFVIMDTNSPEEDHWWPIMSGDVSPPDTMSIELVKSLVRPSDWEFFSQPPAMNELRDEDGNVESYRQNSDRENKTNMSADYYPRIITGKTREWINVYVLNKYGTIADGKPVFTQFNGEVHVAREPIPVQTGAPLWIGIDFGLTPAAVFAQRAHGRWFILSELVAQDMGLVRFCEMLRGHIGLHFSETGEKIIWGDPAGDFRAQTDERRPFDIMRAAGLQARPAQTNDPVVRLESVRSVLDRMVDGKPGLLIDRSAATLIRAFEGGYQYRRLQVSGERYTDTPNKNKYSHVSDALQYVFLGGGEGRQLLQGQSPMKVIQAKAGFNPFERRYAGR